MEDQISPIIRAQVLRAAAEAARKEERPMNRDISISVARDEFSFDFDFGDIAETLFEKHDVSTEQGRAAFIAAMRSETSDEIYDACAKECERVAENEADKWLDEHAPADAVSDALISLAVREEGRAAYLALQNKVPA